MAQRRPLVIVSGAVRELASADSLLAATDGAGTSLAINGDFQINQRVFAGGSLAAGAFGVDRWKADAGGASVSVSGYTVTLSSGTVVQVIEPALWGLSTLALLTVTVSVDTPSADMTVTVGSQSGTITAGSGRRSITLTLASGDTGNVALKLAKASAGSVTFTRVKIEIGPAATAWVPRPRPLERLLAQRYYWKSYLEGHAPGAATWEGAVKLMAYTAYQTGQIDFGVEMRANPTVALFSPQTGASGKLTDPTSSSDTNSGTPTVPNPKGIAYVYVGSGGLTVGREYIGHVTADAEL